MAKKIPPGPASPTEPQAERELTDRQWRFVHEYVAEQNATQAARRAGYSALAARQAGSALLSNPSIRAEIDDLLAEQNAKILEDRAFYLKRLHAQATLDVGEFIEWNEDGERIIPSNRLSKLKRGLVKSYSNSPKNGRQIQFVDQQKALMDILEILNNEHGASSAAQEDAAQKVLGALREAGDE